MEFTLISQESLISSVDGYTSDPDNTLEVPDNSINTSNNNEKLIWSVVYNLFDYKSIIQLHKYLF